MTDNRSSRQIIDGLRARWGGRTIFGGPKLISAGDRDKSMQDLIEVVDQLDKRLRAIEDTPPGK